MKVNKELLKGSTAVLVLSLLEKQPMYGYEMIKILEERSQGVFTFKEGTLYPILHTLEQQGLLHSYWSGAPGSRQRKYYEITTQGIEYQKIRKEEWNMFRSAVDRVITVGEVGI
ncbi:MAG TPA: PadR family transcriptional regulator [Syntrophomonadaceae bacterium]|nr:PadR family transcriptional regulator [Syntrophomonadaceae bacterium]